MISPSNKYCNRFDTFDLSKVQNPTVGNLVCRMKELCTIMKIQLKDDKKIIKNYANIFKIEQSLFKISNKTWLLCYNIRTN